MGSLLRERVTPARPFLHTGVDYAGPILLRTTRGRGHRAYKPLHGLYSRFRLPIYKSGALGGGLRLHRGRLPSGATTIHLPA